MKKLLLGLLIVLGMQSVGWGASVVRYVNTGSTAGGDGTTNATTGDNRAYASLAEAEDAMDGLIFEEGETATINCSGTAADAPTVFADWDSDVTVNVVGDYAKTSGVHFSTDYYRIEATNASLITSEIARLNVSKVQFKMGNTSTYYYGIDIQPGSTVAYNTTIDRCIVDGNGGRGWGGFGAGSGAAGSTMTIKNSVVYGFTTSASQNRGIDCIDADITQNIYNCIVYNIVGGYGGIYASGGTITAKNCAVYTTDNDFNGTITIDYCASDDGDGDHAVQPANWDNVFVNDGNGDFHLKSTDTDLLNKGTDLYGSGVTTDIDGDTLTVRNDIGIDEYASVGESTCCISGEVILF